MKTHSDIPGWFDFPDVYDAVVDSAKSGSVFVEVGCWLGKSTAYLGSRIRRSRKKIKLYAVDTFKGSPNEEAMMATVRRHRGSVFAAFQRNLRAAGVSHLVEPVVATSVNASKRFDDRSLDFVFIDACHTYEAVKADILSWLPKVKPGGVLAGHDFGTYRSVTQAVTELLGPVLVHQNCWIFVGGANVGASVPGSFGRPRACGTWMHSRTLVTMAIRMISG